MRSAGLAVLSGVLRDPQVLDGLMRTSRAFRYFRPYCQGN